MTSEEMERGIELVLKNQATLETQIERTSHQIEQTNKGLEETNKRLETHAETQTEFIQIVTRHIEAQGEINASLRASLARTDDRLDALIDIVREGRNGKS